MVKTIIFDWDGTLHDTKALYGSAFRRGCRWLCENGYADKWDYTDEEASKYIGYSAGDAWRAFRPDLPDEITIIPNRIIGRSMVEDVYKGHARLYPGALDVLSKLKSEGFYLAFLSNCDKEYMNAHREYFCLDNYFDKMYCCGEFGWASKPEVFCQIQKELPGDYIVVGDRASDLETAFVHGLSSIGCSYGCGGEGELEGADYIAENVSDIPGIVSNICGKEI